MRSTAVAGNCRRGRPGWAALAGMVTLAAVVAGLAAGGRPVQAAVRHGPGARTPATIPSDSELQSVSAVSPTDVWAAGGYYNSRGAREPLVLHWNGKTWAALKAPVFPGGVPAYLVGLSALSPTDAWAVGFREGAHSWHSLMLHCNGTACQQVPTPSPVPSAALYGVSAVSPTDVWAAGVRYYGAGLRLMLHWDGTAWTKVATPVPRGSNGTSLGGVSADSATDAWALGTYQIGSGPAESMMLHWNGYAWKLVKTPTIGGAPITAGAMSAVSPTDVWVTSSSPATGDQAIVRWDGTTWTQVKIPAICGTACLYGVSAVSPTDAWTAGSYPASSAYKGLILHCNGTACTRAKSPVPGRTQKLFGVSADSPTDAWAVGGYGSGISLDKILILHWDGTTWTQVSPTGT